MIGTQRRNMEAEEWPWRDVTDWLALHGLLSLFSYRTQDHQPRDGTTQGILSLSHHLLIKKMYVACPQANLMGGYLLN